MEFCPTCGNMLLYELPHMEHPARFSCPTCPYVCNIETKVKIKRRARLVKKPVDPIVTYGDFNGYPEMTVPCPDCDNNKALVREEQTRSADEPMTVYYCCTKCKRTWIGD